MTTEIDYYITMVSKNTELVNHKGSPVLPAHGCGGTRASKNETATNPPSEDATEGGVRGRNSVAPERTKPRRLLC